MNIVVKDYDSQWTVDFEKEKSLISHIVDDNLVNVIHIGSTAVEGLKSKPIIDMLLIVKDLNELDDISEDFEQLQYEVIGEFGIEGRRYFRKGGDDRTHQIHAFEFTNLNEIERHIIFRDYLRAHPDVVKAYGSLKESLAKRYPKDIIAYGDGKEDFVKSTEQDALIWYLSQAS